MPPQLQGNPIPRRTGVIEARCGLMRFALLPTSGMIDAERFVMLPTHRTNFKKGP